MRINTKPLPCIIMLSAGAVTSVMGLINHWELFRFTRNLLIVLILFYIIGGIIKYIFDKAMEYFDEILVSEDQEDYFEALEREAAMKALLEGEEDES